MDFHSDYTIKAVWNISNNSELKIFGELKYTQDKGIEVETYGSLLGTTNIHKIKNGVEEKQIIGFTKEGEHLSLIDCTLYESGSSNGLITTKIYAKYFLKSKELSLLNISKVSTINAHLPAIDKWLDLNTSFKYKFTNQQNSLTLRYKQPKSKKLYEDNQLTVYVYFSWNTQFGSRWQPQTSLQQKAFLNIEFKNKIELTPAIDYLIYAKRIFSLFIMLDARFFELNIFIKENDDLKKIEVLFKDEGRYNIPSRDSNVLIYYPEIKRKFSSIFKNWIIRRKLYEEVLSFYFDIKHRIASNQTNIFLNLCFSLERIHQTFYDKKPFNTGQIQKLSTNIKKITPEKFKQRINDILSHLNQFTFAQRLENLLKINHFYLNSFLEDKAGFIKLVKNTRNS